jgi:SAM-dependent methyltransferase
MKDAIQNTKQIDQGKWDRLADPAELLRMRNFLAPQPGDVVLDAGTGKGNAAKEIAPKVKKVIAIDVEQNRGELLKNTDLHNVEFICADLDDKDFPYEDETFNIVICRAALHHLGNKKRFFKEAFRTLRPQGRLYILDPVMSPELRLAWNIISRIAEKDYRGYCTRIELVEGIIDAGFEIQYSGEFLFQRILRDWIDGKIPLLDSNDKIIENEFVKHVRRTIWTTVFDSFTESMQTELHLDKNSKEGFFAYNCMEILSQKQ